MDIVWMGALLSLWVVVGAMAVGLEKLGAPNPRKASNAADGASS